MEKNITLTAELKNLDVLIESVDNILNELSCSSENRNALYLSIEELFVNITSYAYDNSSGTVNILFTTTDNESKIKLCITFIDKGKPFNPLLSDDPDTTKPLEERNPGGLGIFLVKKNVDEIKYTYEDSCNKLTIYKTLDREV
ncbi:histidine kinase [Spirochaetia bacterium]|nr:histidine kinase [Spirochaetia bacterium]